MLSADKQREQAASTLHQIQTNEEQAEEMLLLNAGGETALIRLQDDNALLRPSLFGLVDSSSRSSLK